VQGFGPGFGGVALGGVAAQGIERGINDLHRVGAPRDLHDRRTLEGLGKGLGVDGGGGDDDAELGPLETQVAQMPEEKVDVERTLVGLVQDHRIVGAQERIALHLGEQHAVGHELDHGVARGAVIEANLAAHLFAPVYPQLLGDAARDGEGRDAARLGAGDLPFAAATGGEAHFGDLGGFARARFPG
jgi:hypothetical protein